MNSTTRTITPEVVVTDTNVLINFIHIQQLALLNRLPNHRFAIPATVTDEVTWETQAKALSEAMAAGLVDPCDLDDDITTTLYNNLLKDIEPGEAACIAIAHRRNQSVATDEKRDARRLAIALVGETRVLQTRDVLHRCIKHGVITVEEADDFKAQLELKRYRMNFDSFADLMAA